MRRLVIAASGVDVLAKVRKRNRRTLTDREFAALKDIRRATSKAKGSDYSEIRAAFHTFLTAERGAPSPKDT